MAKTEFNEALEVEALAEEIIESHPDRGFLQHANICYRFQSTWITSNGKTKAGKLQRPSGLYKHLTDFDYVMVVVHDAWTRMDLPERKALVHHELCHATGLEKDDLWTWGVIGHDVEEFAEVILEHGMWTATLKDFQGAALHNLKATLVGGPSAYGDDTVAYLEAVEQAARKSLIGPSPKEKVEGKVVGMIDGSQKVGVA